MFRPMRRAKQQLPPAEAEAILAGGTSGVLAVLGDDGYPYAVPLSYVYADGKIYFHCAKSGHKLDAVRREAKASFCVVAQDQVVPAEYTTYFRSVIAFGRVRVLTEPREVRAAIEKLARRYAPEDTAARRAELIEKELPLLCMLEFSVEHLTGKEAKELMLRRGE